MGRRIRVQRRGKGASKYLATTNAWINLEYISLNELPNKDLIKGQVVELNEDPTHSGVAALIEFDLNGKIKKDWILAAEGMKVGQEIETGEKAKQEIGNILPLKSVSEGMPVFNIERFAGDGGKFVKASGAYALIVTKDNENAFIKMPSGKMKLVDLESRATIGNAAGSGRKEKPMIKAGVHFHAMKAKARPWHWARGVAMNAIDHPYGGSQHHTGKSKSTSRNAPPGRMVGSIASKRTGRKKR